MYFLFSHYNKQDFQNRYFVSGSRDFFMEYKKSFREKKTFSFHEMPLILPEMYSCTFADLCFRDYSPALSPSSFNPLSILSVLATNFLKSRSCLFSFSAALTHFLRTRTPPTPSRTMTMTNPRVQSTVKNARRRFSPER